MRGSPLQGWPGHQASRFAWPLAAPIIIILFLFCFTGSLRCPRAVSTGSWLPNANLVPCRFEGFCGDRCAHPEVGKGDEETAETRAETSALCSCSTWRRRSARSLPSGQASTPAARQLPVLLGEFLPSSISCSRCQRRLRLPKRDPGCRNGGTEQMLGESPRQAGRAAR